MFNYQRLGRVAWEIYIEASTAHPSEIATPLDINPSTAADGESPHALLDKLESCHSCHPDILP